MTIGEAILAGEKQLVAAGIDSGRLETEMMLAQLREEPRLNLWLQRGDVLTEGQREKLQDWLARRSTREPIQHILGWAPFLDFELHVTRDVLVPRPETEVLAQLAIQRLAGAAAPRVLDWGTGSGCLALAIAQAVPSAEVHALDVSPDALRIARANAIAYRLADRIRFHPGDGFAALDSEFRDPQNAFDLIVTNPPYIPAAEVETLDPEVRLHDPRLALVGGDDGLECYRRLAAEALGWLKPGGWLLAEFGDGQAPALTDLFGKAGWNIEAVEKDLSGRDRILIVRAPVRD
jgi:release factor glutamine methyltransferase